MAERCASIAAHREVAGSVVAVTASEPGDPGVGATRRFVVGSTRGRLPGDHARLQLLFVRDDGRRAHFFDPAFGRDPLYALDIETGEVSTLTDPRLPRASALSSNGRVAAAVVSSTVVWRDVETGASDTVAMPAARAVRCLSHDGAHAWIERARSGPYATTEPLALHRRGASEATLALDAEPVGFTSDGRFAVARTHRAIVRVSLVDGAVTRLPLARSVDGRWGACVERGGARAVVALSATELAVVDLETGRAAVQASPGEGLYLRECGRGVLLLAQSAFAEAGMALRTFTRAYHLDTMTLLRELDGPAALSPDGAWALVVTAPTLARVELATGRVRAWHDGAAGAVRELVWSPDARWLAIAGDATRVVDAHDGSVAWDFEGGPTSSARFSPDGRTLFTLTASSLVAWSLATGDEVSRAVVERSPLHRLDVSPDGRLALVWSLHGDVVLYDLSTGRRVARPGGGRALEGAWFSPSGVATATAKSGLGRGVHVRWRSPDGRTLAVGAVRLTDPSGAVIDARGERLVSFFEGAITSHDLRGAEGARLATGLATLRLAHASPGGIVALAANDQQVWVLDGASARARAMVPLRLPQSTLSLSPDGAALAIAYTDGRVEVISLDA